MNRLAALAVATFALPCQAAPWEFSAPLAVTPAPQPGVFHQLDSAGRKHVAVSGDSVGIVWEENRNGISQVYVAFKPLAAKAFSLQRVSAGNNAAAPVIVALGQDRFLLAWEQDGDIWARAADAGALGPAERIAPQAEQVSVAAADGKIFAVWNQRVDRFLRIRIAPLKVADNAVRMPEGSAHDVDVAPPLAEQIYPDVVVTPAGITVAWEDRRHGHTVLLQAHSNDGKRYNAPQLLNEQLPARSEVYGKGTGVARVALARHGRRGIVAAWLDKRDFLSGYDVYAGFSRDGIRFGSNERVQDDFGNNISQWHAAVAADNTGRVAVAWDDDRDGTADLWLAWPVGAGQWSENLAVPGASGAGFQSGPALVFDAAGNLHLVWVERETLESPTRLRYSAGRFLK